jgi:hypothetical protein
MLHNAWLSHAAGPFLRSICSSLSQADRKKMEKKRLYNDMAEEGEEVRLNPMCCSTSSQSSTRVTLTLVFF